MAGHETLRTRMMAFQDQPYDYGRRPPLAHDDERTRTAVRTRMMIGQDMT